MKKAMTIFILGIIIAISLRVPATIRRYKNAQTIVLYTVALAKNIQINASRLQSFADPSVEKSGIEVYKANKEMMENIKSFKAVVNMDYLANSIDELKKTAISSTQKPLGELIDKKYGQAAISGIKSLKSINESLDLETYDGITRELSKIPFDSSVSVNSEQSIGTNWLNGDSSVINMKCNPAGISVLLSFWSFSGPPITCSVANQDFVFDFVQQDNYEQMRLKKIRAR